MMHTAVVLRAEVKELQAANAMKKRGERKRKERVQEAALHREYGFTGNVASPELGYRVRNFYAEHESQPVMRYKS